MINDRFVNDGCKITTLSAAKELLSCVFSVYSVYSIYSRDRGGGTPCKDDGGIRLVPHMVVAPLDCGLAAVGALAVPRHIVAVASVVHRVGAEQRIVGFDEARLGK